MTNEQAQQTLITLLDGIVAHNAQWGETNVMDVVIRIEIHGNRPVFGLFANDDSFITHDYKSAILALKSAFTPRRDEYPAYHLQ